ncbi:DUF4279 domain-containing protein [Alicyclobacillus fodiniaquatilis]|uniref:DUF4279 domain-containing protein n=1 Tax=Alicyclobacillus fodiniaquatilis TaxID=1661150 RepID=A0ABW4JJS4_9BACL
MERTEVMVYFTIFGDEFPLEVVTQKLGVPPILTYTKGDLIPNRRSKMHYKESAWELSTGYQDSLDVNEQLQQVIGQLVGKETVITGILKTYSLLCKFFIVIVINNGETPSLYLDKSVIHFAANIGAEFDFDLYANPYEGEMD